MKEKKLILNSFRVHRLIVVPTKANLVQKSPVAIITDTVRYVVNVMTAITRATFKQNVLLTTCAIRANRNASG